MPNVVENDGQPESETHTENTSENKQLLYLISVFAQAESRFSPCFESDFVGEIPFKELQTVLKTQADLLSNFKASPADNEQFEVLKLQHHLLKLQYELAEGARDLNTPETDADPRKQTISFYIKQLEDKAENAESDSTTRGRSLTVADALKGQIEFDTLLSEVSSFEMSSSDEGLDTESSASQSPSNSGTFDSDPHQTINSLEDSDPANIASDNRESSEPQSPVNLHKVFPNKEQLEQVKAIVQASKWSGSIPSQKKQPRSFLGSHLSDDNTQKRTPVAPEPVQPTLLSPAPPRRPTINNAEIINPATMTIDGLINDCTNALKEVNQLITYGHHRLGDLQTYYKLKQEKQIYINAIISGFSLIYDQSDNYDHDATVNKLKQIIKERQEKIRNHKKDYLTADLKTGQQLEQQFITDFKDSALDKINYQNDMTFAKAEAAFNEKTTALSNLHPILHLIAERNKKLNELVDRFRVLQKNEAQLAAELESWPNAKTSMQEAQQTALQNIEAKIKTLNTRSQEFTPEQKKQVKKLEKSYQEADQLRNDFIELIKTDGNNKKATKQIEEKFGTRQRALSKAIKKIDDNITSDSATTSNYKKSPFKLAQLISPPTPRRNRSTSKKLSEKASLGDSAFVDTFSPTTTNNKQIEEVSVVVASQKEIINHTYKELGDNWRDTLTNKALLKSTKKLLQEKQLAQNQAHRTINTLTTQFKENDEYIIDSSFQEEINLLSSQLERKTAQKPALLQELAQLESKIAGAESYYQSQQEIIKQAELDQETCKVQLPKIDIAIKKAQHELTALKENLNDKQAQLTLINDAQTKETGENAEENQLQVAHFQSECDKIKESIKQKKESISKLQASHDAVNARLLACEESLPSLKEIAQTFLETKAELTSAKKNIEKKLAGFDSELKEIQDIKERLETCAAAEKQIDLTEQAIPALQEIVDSLPERIQTLHAERDTIYKKQQRALSEAKNAVQLLDKLDDKVTKEDRIQIKNLRKVTLLLTEQIANGNQQAELEAQNQQTNVQLKQYQDSPKELETQHHDLQKDIAKHNKKGSRIEHKLEKALTNTPKPSRLKSSQITTPTAVTPLSASNVRTEEQGSSSSGSKIATITESPLSPKVWTQSKPNLDAARKRLFANDRENDEIGQEEKWVPPFDNDSDEEDDLNYLGINPKVEEAEHDSSEYTERFHFADESEFNDLTEQQADEFTELSSDEDLALPPDWENDSSQSVESASAPVPDLNSIERKESRSDSIATQLRDADFKNWALNTEHNVKNTEDIPPSTPTNTRSASNPRTNSTTPVTSPNSTPITSRKKESRLTKVMHSPFDLVDKAAHTAGKAATAAASAATTAASKAANALTSKKHRKQTHELIAEIPASPFSLPEKKKASSSPASYQPSSFNEASSSSTAAPTPLKNDVELARAASGLLKDLHRCEYRFYFTLAEYKDDASNLNQRVNNIINALKQNAHSNDNKYLVASENAILLLLYKSYLAAGDTNVFPGYLDLLYKLETLTLPEEVDNLIHSLENFDVPSYPKTVAEFESKHKDGPLYRMLFSEDVGQDNLSPKNQDILKEIGQGAFSPITFKYQNILKTVDDNVSIGNDKDGHITFDITLNPTAKEANKQITFSATMTSIVITRNFPDDDPASARLPQKASVDFSGTIKYGYDSNTKAFIPITGVAASSAKLKPFEEYYERRLKRYLKKTNEEKIAKLEKTKPALAKALGDYLPHHNNKKSNLQEFTKARLALEAQQQLYSVIKRKKPSDTQKQLLNRLDELLNIPLPPEKEVLKVHPQLIDENEAQSAMARQKHTRRLSITQAETKETFKLSTPNRSQSFSDLRVLASTSRNDVALATSSTSQPSSQAVNIADVPATPSAWTKAQPQPLTREQGTPLLRQILSAEIQRRKASIVGFDADAVQKQVERILASPTIVFEGDANVVEVENMVASSKNIFADENEISPPESHDSTSLMTRNRAITFAEISDDPSKFLDLLAQLDAIEIPEVETINEPWRRALPGNNNQAGRAGLLVITDPNASHQQHQAALTDRLIQAAAGLPKVDSIYHVSSQEEVVSTLNLNREDGAVIAPLPQTNFSNIAERTASEAELEQFFSSNEPSAALKAALQARKESRPRMSLFDNSATVNNHDIEVMFELASAPSTVPEDITDQEQGIFIADDNTGASSTDSTARDLESKEPTSLRDRSNAISLTPTKHARIVASPGKKLDGITDEDVKNILNQPSTNNLTSKKQVKIAPSSTPNTDELPSSLPEVTVAKNAKQEKSSQPHSPNAPTKEELDKLFNWDAVEKYIEEQKALPKQTPAPLEIKEVVAESNPGYFSRFVNAVQDIFGGGKIDATSNISEKRNAARQAKIEKDVHENSEAHNDITELSNSLQKIGDGQKPLSNDELVAQFARALAAMTTPEELQALHEKSLARIASESEVNPEAAIERSRTNTLAETLVTVRDLVIDNLSTETEQSMSYTDSDSDSEFNIEAEINEAESNLALSNIELQNICANTAELLNTIVQAVDEKDNVIDEDEASKTSFDLDSGDDQEIVYRAEEENHSDVSNIKSEDRELEQDKLFRSRAPAFVTPAIHKSEANKTVEISKVNNKKHDDVDKQEAKQEPKQKDKHKKPSLRKVAAAKLHALQQRLESINLKAPKDKSHKEEDNKNAREDSKESKQRTSVHLHPQALVANANNTIARNIAEEKIADVSEEVVVAKTVNWAADVQDTQVSSDSEKHDASAFKNNTVKPTAIVDHEDEPVELDNEQDLSALSGSAIASSDLTDAPQPVVSQLGQNNVNWYKVVMPPFVDNPFNHQDESGPSSVTGGQLQNPIVVKTEPEFRRTQSFNDLSEPETQAAFNKILNSESIPDFHATNESKRVPDPALSSQPAERDIAQTVDPHIEHDVLPHEIQPKHADSSLTSDVKNVQALSNHPVQQPTKKEGLWENIKQSAKSVKNRVTSWFNGGESEETAKTHENAPSSRGINEQEVAKVSSNSIVVQETVIQDKKSPEPQAEERKKSSYKAAAEAQKLPPTPEKLPKPKQPEYLNEQNLLSPANKKPLPPQPNIEPAPRDKVTAAQRGLHTATDSQQPPKENSSSPGVIGVQHEPMQNQNADRIVNSIVTNLHAPSNSQSSIGATPSTFLGQPTFLPPQKQVITAERTGNLHLSQNSYINEKGEYDTQLMRNLKAWKANNKKDGIDRDYIEAEKEPEGTYIAQMEKDGKSHGEFLVYVLPDPEEQHDGKVKATGDNCNPHVYQEMLDVLTMDLKPKENTSASISSSSSSSSFSTAIKTPPLVYVTVKETMSHAQIAQVFESVLNKGCVPCIKPDTKTTQRECLEWLTHEDTASKAFKDIAKQLKERVQQLSVYEKRLYNEALAIEPVHKPNSSHMNSETPMNQQTDNIQSHPEAMTLH